MTTRASREPGVLRETVWEFTDETLKLLAYKPDREARSYAKVFEEMVSVGLLGMIFPEEHLPACLRPYGARPLK